MDCFCILRQIIIMPRVGEMGNFWPHNQCFLTFLKITLDNKHYNLGKSDGFECLRKIHILQKID